MYKEIKVTFLILDALNEKVSDLKQEKMKLEENLKQCCDENEHLKKQNKKLIEKNLKLLSELIKMETKFVDKVYLKNRY